MKRKIDDDSTTDSTQTAKRTNFIKDQLPDMSYFTPEMRSLVIDSHLHITRLTRHAKDDLTRHAKDDLLRLFKEADVLHKILKNPRLCHLKYVREFSSEELDDTDLVRFVLLKQVENVSKLEINRNTVFGHLWAEIAEFLDEESAESWVTAFPGLVPRV